MTPPGFGGLYDDQVLKTADPLGFCTLSWTDAKADILKLADFIVTLAPAVKGIEVLPFCQMGATSDGILIFTTN
jgi:hypothetical protein